MSETTEGYPRKAWKLMPSFKPVEIELTAELSYCWGDDKWASTSTGGSINLSEVWNTREEAIAAGWERVEVQQADIDKRQERLNKRKAALTKATGAPA